MNKVFLIGNLTRDPELTTTANGASVCRFAIAVNRPFAGNDGERKSDFFNITAWRDLGERIAQYQKKGNKVAVTGSVQIREYEDNNGNKRQTVDVIAQEVEFLTPRQGEEIKDLPKSAKKPTLQAYDDDSDIPF